MTTIFSRRRLTTNWYEKQSHAESFSSRQKCLLSVSCGERNDC